MKKLLLALAILVVLLLIVQRFQPTKNIGKFSGPDARNLSYDIEGQPVRLINGAATEQVAPGSAAKMVTQYFGNEVSGDFNSDGLNDMAFLLTQTGGGSGTFYYIVTALSSLSGYKGSNAVFLGDRIAPQTTEFRDGRIIVNFAERERGQAMTDQPSVGVSKYFVVESDKLVSADTQ